MKLYGHDTPIADFEAGLAEGRLHHAWLLAGPEGIGKSSFGEFAARRLLSEKPGQPAPEGFFVSDRSEAAHLIAAESHPDFRRLERLPRDKKELEKPRADRDPDIERARNISIGQIRSLHSLLDTTPSLSSWRAVLIDAVDDLEGPAANALLKSLEEPPARTIFLLVSHNPGRLLPTIRSRCRKLRFQPLGDDVMTSAIRQAMPEIDEAELAALVAVGEGAPGRALRYAGVGIGELDGEIGALIAEGDVDNARRSALAQSLALKKTLPRYEAFLQRAPRAAARHARGLDGAELDRAIRVWEDIRSLARIAPRAALDQKSTAFALAGMLASLHEPAHG